MRKRSLEESKDGGREPRNRESGAADSAHVLLQIGLSPYLLSAPPGFQGSGKMEGSHWMCWSRDQVLAPELKRTTWLNLYRCPSFGFIGVQFDDLCNGDVKNIAHRS